MRRCGDDADKPRDDAATDSRHAEKEGANPGRVLTEDGGQPGDEDRILRSQTKTGNRGAEIEDMRRMRDGDEGRAEGGDEESTNGNDDLRNTTKGKGCDAASKEQRAVIHRRSSNKSQ